MSPPENLVGRAKHVYDLFFGRIRMQHFDHDDALSNAIAELREEAVEMVERRIKRGDDPFFILDQCQRGLQLVGEHYEQGVYYISGLIIAGEIMNQIAKSLLPAIERSIAAKDSGCIVIGTVQGDIHSLGKDLVKVLLRCYGFTVHDMGVDLPPDDLVKANKEYRPDIIGLSCLINSCYDQMKDTIEMVRESMEKDQKPPVFIIGGQVDETVRRYCEADYWVNDAMAGVRLCQLIVK